MAPVEGRVSPTRSGVAAVRESERRDETQAAEQERTAQEVAEQEEVAEEVLEQGETVEEAAGQEATAQGETAVERHHVLRSHVESWAREIGSKSSRVGVRRSNEKRTIKA